MVYLMVFLLFCVGVYCILAKKNLIKIIIGIGIIEYALNLLFVLFGYRYQGRAPILPRHAPNRSRPHRAQGTRNLRVFACLASHRKRRRHHHPLRKPSHRPMMFPF